MASENLRINEVFHSIQGESTWVGCPCVFVRLSGCHLRCRYCDTSYAFTQGESRPIQQIVAEVCSYPCMLVEITGGEPLLQPRVHDLVQQLCNRGRTVLIETSGACDISPCDPRAIRIMDLKTPGSGETDRTIWSNLDHLNQRDEVKFVITDRADYQWSVDVIGRYDLASRVNAVLLSPVFAQPANDQIDGCEPLEPRDLAEWLLADQLPANVRMQTQLHKLIWHPQMRGV
jgi:7-carboxy-7-deazaguanine synthase